MNKVVVEVSLSRLHKVAERLKIIANEALASSQRLAQNVSLNGVGGASQVERLKAQAKDAFEASERAEKYLRECARVRTQIGSQNEQRGIAALMAQQDVVNKLVSHKKSLLEQAKSVGAVAPDELLDYKVVVSGEGRFSMSSGVSVNVLGSGAVSTLEQEISDLQREAFTLSDKMAELNSARVKMEFDPEIAKEVLGV